MGNDERIEEPSSLELRRSMYSPEELALNLGVSVATLAGSAAARRTLNMTSESRLILGRRMAGESPWVFPSKRNSGQPVRRVHGAHDAVLKKAADDGITLNFVLYDLRHAWATRAAQAGIDIATLAAIMGHSSLRILQRDVHPTAAHKKAAMAIYEETVQRLDGRIQ